jgi:hypothetical protein
MKNINRNGRKMRRGRKEDYKKDGKEKVRKNEEEDVGANNIY